MTINSAKHSSNNQSQKSFSRWRRWKNDVNIQNTGSAKLEILQKLKIVRKAYKSLNQQLYMAYLGWRQRKTIWNYWFNEMVVFAQNMAHLLA